MPNKKNTPGCPCCTPTGCDVTFNITACCGPAVGASIVVKDGSGTTKGTGTTNSSGSVTISLAGTSGQTLYVTVSYDATHYDQYTSVLLGAHCGRTYAYTLTPKTETYGGTICGSITLSTVGCNGTTILGGKAWTLQKASAGGYATYATGTTDATTGKSTVTGVTYGGAFDGYRFLVTDATGTITGTAFTLTSTNCAASVVMRMSTVAGSPCSTPNDAVTLSGGSAGITAQRLCCATCGPTSIPAVLSVLNTPNTVAYQRSVGSSWTYANSCSTTKITTNGPWGSCQFVQWQWYPEVGTPGCSIIIPWATIPYIWAQYYYWDSAPHLTCELDGWYLQLQYVALSPTCNGKTVASGGQTVWVQKVKASSVTCAPFAATFNFPAVGGSGNIIGYDQCSVPANLFPAATVTVTE